MFAIAFLAVAALLPASAFAAPAAASSSCTSIRTGPLGYNATGIPIYSDQAPYSYLAFEGLRDENGNQILQPTTAPEDFEFFVCEQGPLGQGKGDPVYSLGYIASTKAAGYCITASALQDANATFVSKPCKFTSDKEISLHQNFQFVDDSFYNYKVADFLGGQRGPTSNYKNFGASGGDYHYTIQHSSADYLRLRYAPGKSQSLQHDLIFHTNFTGIVTK